MISIQMISAHIGRVTGKGIGANLREHYAAWITISIIFLLLLANIINIAADIAGMGEAVTLLIGGPPMLWGAALTLISLLLLVFIPYDRYVSWLRWLSLVLLTYVGVIFAVKVQWMDAFKEAIIPKLSLDHDYLAMVIAVLGTTISPYLFFWQASEEVEEEDQRPPLKKAPQDAPAEFTRIKRDTLTGMVYSNIVAMCIVISTAVTLRLHGITTITSAGQAAEALRPIAGPFTFILFAIGIIGTGLLALPVLAGSAAYAVGEVLKYPIGLEKKPKDAKVFYGVIAASLLIGIGLTVININPITALFWSAVLNGVTAGPIMIMMMLIATNREAMGPFTLRRWLRIGGWGSAIVMLVAAAGLFLTM